MPDGAMTSWIKALAWGVGGIAVVGMATLVAFQERLVYVPVLPGLSRAYTITPSRFHLDYEDVWLHSSDGVRLHAWFLKHSPPVSGSRVSTISSLSLPSLPISLNCTESFGT